MNLKPIIRSIRARCCDVAFNFRMGAGFPGDVNRTHPVSVEPALQNVTLPATAYGMPVIAAGDTTNSVKRLGAGDTGVTVLYGITVRPFPIQDTGAAGATGGQSLGAATPPATGEIDVMRSGYIMAQLNSGSAQPNKGGAVFVWVAATAAGHVQGQFEAAANGGNTCALSTSQYFFNGPSDSAGVVEIACNP